jgi:hypothetical protein
MSYFLFSIALMREIWRLILSAGVFDDALYEAKKALYSPQFAQES